MPKVPSQPMQVPADPFAGINPAIIKIAEFEQIEADRRVLRLGKDAEREQIISKHGPEWAYDVLKREHESLEGAKSDSGSGQHRKDIKLWLNRLQERMGGEDTPQS